VTAWSATALALWFLVSVASIWVWLPAHRGGKTVLSRTPVLITTGAILVALTGVVALLGLQAPPLPPPWSWVAVGVSGLAALLIGGAVTYCVLALADATSRPGSARVQRTVLRGGAWIGALERLGMFATVLGGWPLGVVCIVAVKAFARYPELKSGQATGAVERFIIGTFASLGWAAACAGIAAILR
jgi:hypothetical protein